MAALTIAGTDIPIRTDGHDQGWEDLGEMTRSGAGYLRSNVTATRGRAKVWRFVTIWLANATASTIEAVLNAMGSVTADGYLVAGSPLSAHVRNLNVEEHETAQYTRFTFELHAVATD